MTALLQHPEYLGVARLGPGADLPSWAAGATLVSVTATATETSIVCAHAAIPRKAKPAGPFAAYAVAGTLDLGLVGILAGLLPPLADAEVSVFVLSTFDTDWLLVPVEKASTAEEAWRRSGHEISPAPLPITDQD